MKKITATILVLVLLSSPLGAVARDQVDEFDILELGGKWDFAYTPKHDDAVPDREEFKTSLPVPGCWDDSVAKSKALALWPDAQFNPNFVPLQIPLPAKFRKSSDASLPYLLGCGWYRRQLDVPSAWRGRQVVLRVGRVVMEAWVYLNGKMVHHHLGHSVPWEVVLSPHLEYGKPNELVIAVDNRRNDRLGCIIRGWKGRSGGIFGPVSLKVSGEARIADAYVFPEGNQLVWRARLEGRLPAGAKLHWSVVDPRDGTRLGVGAQAVDGRRLTWTTPALGIPFWSDETPRLLEIRLELLDAERRLDFVRQPFGRRRLTRDGIGLRLNGRAIFLRGLCDSAYFPETCTPPLEIDWYRRHVRRLKRLGFNWIRGHTWVPTEEYLQAADELGMLVQVEPPRGYQMEEWIDIIRACRKHPSVVIYCCGNEEMLNERKIAFLRRCAKVLRSEVPDALFNPQEAMRGIEYLLGRIPRKQLARKPFPHHPKRLAAVREFSDVFGQYTWGWLSYTTLQGTPAAIDRCLAIYQRPCLTHELGILGCYLDLSLEERYRGTRIGPDLFARVRAALDEAGLLDRADRYYQCSAAWQRLLSKDACETARRCRTLAGYDMLGACDINWLRSGYACGIMNEFDEMKTGTAVADVLRYNGPSVLLVDRRRERNLWAGKPFHRDVFVSWFGAEPLAEATFRWSLVTTDGTVLGQGEQPAPRVEPGRIDKLATIRLDLPPSKKPTKATLRVALSGAEGTIDNRWDYWIFPRAASAPSQQVLFTSVLDAKAVERLARAGRVVLLGHKPLPARRMSFQINMVSRPDGNLATLIEKHPLTDRFPHDGYCDWQFFKMLNQAVPVQFNGLGVPFDPIIEVASSYKRIRKQAVVFEWRVGRGRLLVCGLRLADSDPAGAYFRQLLHEYAASEAFRPKTQISLEQLAKITKLDVRSPEEEPEMDKALDPAGQLPSKR